ncbi:chromate efflux transporter [Halomicroarcula sp. S1AR25-4]|uniref:chromate efflux transporter n=1 Tax=Haloarcula sp. S1AR25-4 TaxID=2950538 RepID=UPI0028767BC4|nr:chromate efflux transporter [Halomicroarcula sp. S1AR25-4]MDS0278812.1 chromate efflux transporter [Halomicroarcula sp. S1AR25-4]
MAGDPATDATVEGASEYKGSATRSRLAGIARFFLKLGLIGFGGPLVHIAMMEDELVGEWTDESTFMEGLAICNMLPGPASTQLGIFMGWVRGGNLGALVAGATFMAPTFVIVVALTYVYFAFGQLPSVQAFFYGVNPVVIGLIGGAAYSMGRSSLREGRPDLTVTLGGDEWTIDLRLFGLLTGALVATVLVNPNPVVEFAVAGAVAVFLFRPEWVRANWRRVSLGTLVALAVGTLYAFRARAATVLGDTLPLPAALTGLFAAVWGNLWIKLFLFMLYTGSFIFGGGLVLIPFIEKYVVGVFGWLTATQFVDGIAIGQLTPGPVVMTTAFVGYKLMLDAYGSVGWAVLGAFVAMLGAFAPSFLFITGAFPYVARVRDDETVRAALYGINAAVVGAIVGATVTLAVDAFAVVGGSPFGVTGVDPFRVALAVTTFALFTRDVDAMYLILGGGLVGASVFFVV